MLEFADRLREDGIDASIDQYEVAPPGGWALWTAAQIRESDFVIVVCTETYQKRAEGREEPDKGHGAIWESFLAIQQVYKAAVRDNKLIPVLLDGAKPDDIPAFLQGRPYYLVSTEQGYEELYRRLTNQPRVEKPVLGKLKSLPRRERQALIAKLWNVPHERNPVFTGREEILIQLYEELAKNKKQALSGLGGIGKTQIAVEYAYRHRDNYTAVLWTFADSEQSVNTGFGNIAKLLDLAEKDSAEQAKIIDSVRRWLHENEKWLLVFDNADTPAILSDFLPQQPRGHILITSRAYTFQNLGILKPREVSVLTPTAALEFLLKRTQREGTAESEEAEALAKELGYLPLALEQAAAYIAENQSSFKNYLASYRRQGLKLLDKQGPILGGSEQQQKRTVATAWSLNFADVEKNSPASADLLRLSAFLAPDAIPLELLEKGSTEMGDRLAPALAKAKDDLLVIDELLKPLASYSLIRRNPETRGFSIHPLVQDVIKDGMTSKDRKLWAERAVETVNATFPNFEFQNWSDCDRLISHSLVCADLINSHKLESETAARLLHQAATYLYERARSAEAEMLFRYALDIYTRVFDAEDEHTATTLNNLGSVYWSQGRYAEAEPSYQRALNIREKVLGPEHADTASTLNNLATLYHRQRKYGQAEPLYLRALQVAEKALGGEHPNLASAFDNLGSLYTAQRRYHEAEPFLRRALSIREKTCGTDHPDTAVSLNNIALWYLKQKRYTEAETSCRRAIEIAQKALGLGHPRVALYAENLIFCYRSQGKDKEAAEFERGLKEAIGN